MVIDTDAMEPVPGAEVVIFDGPQSPIEGSISSFKKSTFLPNPDSPGTESHLTDGHGICRFSYKFWAAGSDGLLDHSGYVDTSHVWVRVSAADRTATLVPLDRQSVRPRDINDETPLVVTVVLNKRTE
jgi:hypothetical protein